MPRTTAGKTPDWTNVSQKAVKQTKADTKAKSTKQTAKIEEQPKAIPTPTPTAGTVHLVTVPLKGKKAEVATAV